ncbi:MFS transporter [Massilia sp. B-10]|nr:MFS transporter [Massilia sp. B-10]
MIGFLMLQPLSTDLYLASLPSLGSVFGAPSSKVQLTLSMFVIAFGGAQLIIGPLSDRFGHRPVVIAGLALYVLASLLCALSPTIELLIAARFVQALGCCSAIIIARHRARRLRTGRQRPRGRTRQHLAVGGAADRPHSRLLAAGDVRLASRLRRTVAAVVAGAAGRDPAPAGDQ